MNIFSSYKKAKAVVASCDDALQLKAAKRYVNLWFVAHTEPARGNRRVVDTLTGELYQKLNNQLYVKKYELKRWISE